jgi:hypothetical protein
LEEGGRKSMKRILHMSAVGTVALLILAGFSGIPAGGDCTGCMDELNTDLIAGKNMDVGDIYITHDLENLYIEIETISTWWISEYHVHVAMAMKSIPQTKPGSPKVGHFEYSDTFDKGDWVQELDFEIAFDDVPDKGEDPFDWCDEIFIAIHVVVNKMSRCTVTQSETGWGDGEDLPKGWAMYIIYKPCKPVKDLPSMPARQVRIKVSHNADKWKNGLWDAYFHTVVDWQGQTPLPNVDSSLTYYIGWCSNNNGAPYISSGLWYWTTLYCSYDPPTSSPDLDYDYWDNINWILNNKDYKYMDGSVEKTVNYRDIQEAIWGYTDTLASGGYTPATKGGKALFAAAETDGDGFFPKKGQNFAVICWINANTQLTIIEVDP